MSQELPDFLKLILEDEKKFDDDIEQIVKTKFPFSWEILQQEYKKWKNQNPTSSGSLWKAIFNEKDYLVLEKIRVKTCKPECNPQLLGMNDLNDLCTILLQHHNKLCPTQQFDSNKTLWDKQSEFEKQNAKLLTGVTFQKVCKQTAADFRAMYKQFYIPLMVNSEEIFLTFDQTILGILHRVDECKQGKGKFTAFFDITKNIDNLFIYLDGDARWQNSKTIEHKFWARCQQLHQNMHVEFKDRVWAYLGDLMPITVTEGKLNLIPIANMDPLAEAICKQELTGEGEELVKQIVKLCKKKMTKDQVVVMKEHIFLDLHNAKLQDDWVSVLFQDKHNILDPWNKTSNPYLV